MRSNHRRSAVISAALLLSACASDASLIRSDGRPPNPERLEADASDCASVWPMVGGFFVGAAYGALQGAAAGASSGGADVGAIVGAGVGAVVGLSIGAVAAFDGENYNRCMRGRGYVRAAAISIPPRPEPIAATPQAIETASTPPLLRVDPAR